MPELADEESKELKSTFDKYDKNNNGCLDWDEFTCLIDELVGEMTLEEKSVAFHLVDSDHNGWINFEEFVTWWGNR